MKKIIFAFFTLFLIFKITSYAENYEETKKKYFDSLINKPIDIAGLYEDYGFIGVLEGVHYEQETVLRIKGFVQRAKCKEKVWKNLDLRKDKVTLRLSKPDLKNPNNEAIALDCILDVGDNVLLRGYDGYDAQTDDFLSQLKSIDINSIPCKVMIMKDAMTDKHDILVQEIDKTSDFKNLVKELGFK